MTVSYEPKQDIVKAAIDDVTTDVGYLHPSDKPIALREVAKWCIDEANKHDVANDFNGVPER